MSVENIKIIKTIKKRGKKLVYVNCSLLYKCFKVIFIDDKFASKINIKQWPVGKTNDYSFEAVKLLYYVFRKIDYINENKSNDTLVSKYLNVIDNFVKLISMSIKYGKTGKLYKDTVEILTKLLNMFGEIKDILSHSDSDSDSDSDNSSNISTLISAEETVFNNSNTIEIFSSGNKQ